MPARSRSIVGRSPRSRRWTKAWSSAGTRRVAPADEVWHLGDFAIRASAERVADLLARLHGRKHLVAGNNDPPATQGLAGWSSVQPYAELMIDERRLVLCHYAFRTWRDMSRGALNLHGHSHGRMKPLPRQIDVGVDAWDFRPQTLSALLARRAPAAMTEPVAR